MAKAKTNPIRSEDGRSTDSNNDEDRGLLSGNSSDNDEDDDLVVHPGTALTSHPPPTPRTLHHVRFDLPSPTDSSPTGNPPLDYASNSHGRHAHAPLLADITAPAVTLANSWGSDDNVEEWAERERSRPKSNLSSAFMNMANSIIGSGIIGQPYALKQAGLLTGTILLIALTITVDWTIRLIVINSKLSGRDSFQGTMEHCFGKAGLVAISVAQWAFAFGGMVAFGIIVGDSVPHVIAALWPGIGEVMGLSWLVDRRAVIVVFILGVSYPLSLYRDIAKVCFSNG